MGSSPVRLTVCVLVVVLVSRGSSELLQNGTAQQTTCLENHEYPHLGFCCRNCEAGTYVKEKCTADKEKGTCASCEQGTYAEHPTGMEQCLQCSQCHMDQITTKECTASTNTQCECKPGLFCLPDEPCEVCKKCSRCKADETEVEKCTPTSNTKCRKRPQLPADHTDKPTIIPAPQNNNTIIAVFVVFPLVVVAVLVGVAVWWFWWKKRSCGREASPVVQNDEVKIPIDMCVGSVEEKENSHNAGLEEGEEPRPESRPLLQETQGKSVPVEDEDRGLGDSLPNTTSSSQTSLTVQPNTPNTPNTLGESPLPSPPLKRPVFCNGEREPEPWAKDDGPPRRLLPLMGEESSLIKSFDLFDSLDLRMHNKFFRSIGLSDNEIKRAECQNSADKVYELLRNWMQRQGLRANINHLLEALLELDQRYTAEQIASKAVERGYYKYE